MLAADPDFDHSIRPLIEDYCLACHGGEKVKGDVDFSEMRTRYIKEHRGWPTTPKGEYLGGVIAPGVSVSAEALFERAARLHRVSVRKPQRVIGRHTEQSLRSGLFHGYVALVEGLVQRVREELGQDAPVVATGGLARVFESELGFLEAVDPRLTLEGLRLIWRKNRK